MKRVLASVIAAIAVALGSAAVPGTMATGVAVAKTCSAGYTHAVIGGAQKCLRRGQFCSMRYRSQYPRYGYRCIAGRLR